MPAIEVSGLRKAYGNLEAVRGVDFTIEEGEVFGLLGPNGAGKTTTVEILEGYRKRDAGEVRVLGHDPERPAPDFRERIGVVLQQSELWPNLTVREIARDLRRLLRAPARRRRGHRARRAPGEGGRARQDALGRPEAAARPRHRARRRPRPRLPRRADDGLRPAGAPRGVGDDPLPPLARQDRAAHDALPRRGRAARRPRRRPAGRRRSCGSGRRAS